MPDASYDSPATNSPAANDLETTNPAPKPRRFRVGLGTLLLLLTIVALAVAQFAATRRVVQYQAENKQLEAANAALRVEAGHLEVTDPKKVAVLQVPQLDELTWQWKVYLPKGQWELHEQVRGISQSGHDNASGSSSLIGNRQVLISASVRKGLNDAWQLVIKTDNSSSRMTLGEDHRLIGPNKTDGFTNNNVGLGKVDVFEADQPIELFRLRTTDRIQSSKTTSTHKAPAVPTDGILIWIKKK